MWVRVWVRVKVRVRVSSPSMEKTPSVITRMSGCSPFFLGVFCSSFAALRCFSRSPMSELSMAARNSASVGGGPSAAMSDEKAGPLVGTTGLS